MLWASSLQKDHWKFADLSWAGNRGSQKDRPEGHCQGQEVVASHQGLAPMLWNPEYFKRTKKENGPQFPGMQSGHDATGRIEGAIWLHPCVGSATPPSHAGAGNVMPQGYDRL